MTFVHGCGRIRVEQHLSTPSSQVENNGFGTGEALRLPKCGVTSAPACRKVGVVPIDKRVTHCRISNTP